MRFLKNKIKVLIEPDGKDNLYALKIEYFYAHRGKFNTCCIPIYYSFYAHRTYHLWLLSLFFFRKWTYDSRLMTYDFYIFAA